jgi:hypothetical protein
MNDFEVTSAIQLDRLVDGELSEAERHEVLVALDRDDCDPTCGWRRLALAFVESQTLHRELRSGCLPSHPHSPGAVLTALAECGRSSVVATVQTHRAPVAGWLRAAALVACGLFAFGIGRWSSPVGRDLARVEQRPVTTPQTFVGPTQNDENTELAAVESPKQETQQTLRLVLDDLLGGPPQSVEVPVVSDSQIDPVEWLDSPPSVPADVQRALLRAGRLVHEQRQLFEVEMSDGRRGIVPVSDVTVVNAGSDVYQ